jgi:SAM-dependent methyltransferase
MNGHPKLYWDYADWYHLLTAPEDYAEEAAFYLALLTEALGHPPRSVVELGAGGGSMAWHYKRQVPAVTLTELSPAMVELGRQLNPDCENLQGDMRDLRLGRQFDAVFAHDAICYMTTEADLRLAMETAWTHCRPGGAAVFAPDLVRENFVDEVDTGGHDGQGRALRYMLWTSDPDPTDDQYLDEFVYVLHEAGHPTRTIYDPHLMGLFSRETWLRLLRAVGFQASVRPLVHSEVPPGAVEVFVCRKPV